MQYMFHMGFIYIYISNDFNIVYKNNITPNHNHTLESMKSTTI
jgi:hypothetical protein